MRFGKPNMSRIGKKSIKIPAGVEIKVDDGKVKVKGPKGELERELPQLLEIRILDGAVSVGLREASAGPGRSSKEDSQLWGLGRALLANMVKGVSDGFQKALEFNGVGFKAQVKGDSLELNLGFTNPVIIKGPPGVTFKVEKNTITVEGMDREKVGHVAALIRDARPPEPYKGTGIKYKDEVIRRKAGKKAVATG